MPRNDTRQRIQQVARELFLANGVAQTSLNEIASRVGITKPALYHHFASRDELVHSIVVPMLDEWQSYLARVEAGPDGGPRALLEGYFDVHLAHRDLLVLAVREMSTLADLRLLESAMEWRARIGELLVGPDAPLAAQCRVVVALGGLADCAISFDGVPVAQLRAAAVDAACRALGVG